MALYAHQDDRLKLKDSRYWKLSRFNRSKRFLVLAAIVVGVVLIWRYTASHNVSSVKTERSRSKLELSSNADRSNFQDTAYTEHKLSVRQPYQSSLPRVDSGQSTSDERPKFVHDAGSQQGESLAKENVLQDEDTLEGDGVELNQAPEQPS